jgi:AbrB family looped-hinge helix DNA binding protein
MPAMETTKLSSKGQVVLPKAVRESQGWAAGTEFVVEPMPDGVLLRAVKPFATTQLETVFGSLARRGRARTVAEMDDGIRAAVARRHRRATAR